MYQIIVIGWRDEFLILNDLNNIKSNIALQQTGYFIQINIKNNKMKGSILCLRDACFILLSLWILDTAISD